MLKTLYVMFDIIAGKRSKTVILSVGLAVLCSTVAKADICFLPGGKCPGNREAVDVRNSLPGEQCIGYNLTQIKNEGQFCEDGWDCESCTNAQGTFYKCTPKETPEGYTPGLEKCDSPCQRYSWNGCTGSQINGKCEDIANLVSAKPDPCRTYIAPNYVCGIEVDGTTISELTKDNDECPVCYTNIVKMNGYSTTMPASCTTYNSRRNGLATDQDVMCYTSGTSIGEYFSTAERDAEAFIIETKYGVDTFISPDGKQKPNNTEACYRAIGCNSAKGWLPASDIDGDKFEYLEQSSDSIICRKATACNESNNWFDNEKLGQFKNTYFTMIEETRSGITCYNSTGCHNRAYYSQPDAKYFKSSKKTANGKDCWIITGKADYAYEADEKRVDYFEYDAGKEGYLNGTDEKVKYYLINKCMKYSYDTKPDIKYFSSDSLTRKSGGTNKDITCWNITGKGEFAYDGNEKEADFFAFDSGKEGYLNGTSTKVKYYVIAGCNTPYSYTSQPDIKYFSSSSLTRKSGGTNKDITCWNITGKGEFAYTESEKKSNFFAYDVGKEGYLNGTSTTTRYFNITDCSPYAYSKEPDKTFFLSEKNTKKKGGVDADITCWNVTGKAKYAYKDNERKISFFDYDQSTAYINGTSAQETYYRAKKCSMYAYGSEPDAKYFSYTKETQKKDGIDSDLTCWNITGKGKYAYTEAEKKPLYFKYDAGKEGYLNGTADKGKYFNAVALADGSYDKSPDTKAFKVNKEEAYKGGVNRIMPSWRATGCNTANNYSTTAPDIRFFTYDRATASGITCYMVKGCLSSGGITSVKPQGCKTWDSVSYSSLVCYYNISTPAKPADSEKCGTCGYRTRSVVCGSNGSGWEAGSWSDCTETPRDALSQSCGCGGTKTRTATCATDGKSWSYSDWGPCSKGDCSNNEACIDGECVCVPGNGKFGSVCCEESDCGYSSDSKLHCYSGICHECEVEGSSCVATGHSPDGFLWNGRCRRGECIFVSL